MNTESLDEIFDNIDKQAEWVENKIFELTDHAVQELDVFINKTKKLMGSIAKVSTVKLEELNLELSILLYRLTEEVERAGVTADSAKAYYKDIYRRAYGSAEGTATAKKLSAEQQASQEQIVHDMLQRAERLLNKKAEAGREVLMSLKKVITARSNLRID